jgi:hypothetical protein
VARAGPHVANYTHASIPDVLSKWHAPETIKLNSTATTRMCIIIPLNFKPSGRPSQRQDDANIAADEKPVHHPHAFYATHTLSSVSIAKNSGGSSQRMSATIKCGASPSFTKTALFAGKGTRMSALFGHKS